MKFQPLCHNHAENDPAVEKSSDPSEMKGHVLLTHCKRAMSRFVSVSAALPLAIVSCQTKEVI